MERSNLYIGVMSGTSLDGIDIALCKIDNNEIKTIATKEYDFDKNIKRDILEIISNPITLEFLGILNHKLSLMYSDALLKFLEEFNINAKDILFSNGKYITMDFIDPKNGKAYKLKAEIIDGGKKLKLRGYIGVAALGRNQTWIRTN